MADHDQEPSLGDLVKASSPKLLQKASPKERSQLFGTPLQGLLQSNVSITSQSHFSGPIPPPETLAHYEEIMPGATARIMAMAENQSAHRQQLEDKVISAQLVQSSKGQHLGFCIGIVGILAACAVGIWGHWAVGVAIAAGSLGTLTASFVFGQSSQKKDLEKKRG